MNETDQKHPDYALCQQAAEKMEQARQKRERCVSEQSQVGSAVNERRRELEAEEQRVAQLRSLSEQIAGLKSALLDDNRR